MTRQALYTRKQLTAANVQRGDLLQTSLNCLYEVKAVLQFKRDTDVICRASYGERRISYPSRKTVTVWRLEVGAEPAPPPAEPLPFDGDI